MIYPQNCPKRLPPNTNLNSVLSRDGTQGFLISPALKTSIVAIKSWTEVRPRDGTERNTFGLFQGLHYYKKKKVNLD